MTKEYFLKNTVTKEYYLKNTENQESKAPPFTIDQILKEYPDNRGGEQEHEGVNDNASDDLDS
jgi:hypothetical protein